MPIQSGGLPRAVRMKNRVRSLSQPDFPTTSIVTELLPTIGVSQDMITRALSGFDLSVRIRVPGTSRSSSWDCVLR